MLERLAFGRLPEKPHLLSRAPDGRPLYEECCTRAGFDGPFSILYHRFRPHEPIARQAEHGFALPAPASSEALLRRHFRCLSLPSGGPSLNGRLPLLFNEQIVIGFTRPTADDPVYFVNADADELFFVLSGGGVLRTIFGDLDFLEGDYVCVPKGTLYRFRPDAARDQAWLTMECKGGLGIPSHYRNALGQLRMDAPYSHRDFRRPRFIGPMDEGIRDVVVKRGDAFFGFRHDHAPLDVVGWDGSVYPFAFPILAFQPRVGQIHLPPPVHTTFQAAGAVICSFVPRPLDFHPLANPCPYPHSSFDVDEVLLYVNGAFSSRRGIDRGSLSLHPAGIAHGPHPGAYENAAGQSHTDEVAVMLDCSAPLRRTAQAANVEDSGYQASFRETPPNGG